MPAKLGRSSMQAIWPSFQSRTDTDRGVQAARSHGSQVTTPSESPREGKFGAGADSRLATVSFHGFRVEGTAFSVWRLLLQPLRIAKIRRRPIFQGCSQKHGGGLAGQWDVRDLESKLELGLRCNGYEAKGEMGLKAPAGHLSRRAEAPCVQGLKIVRVSAGDQHMGALTKEGKAFNAGYFLWYIL